LYVICLLGSDETLFENVCRAQTWLAIRYPVDLLLFWILAEADVYVPKKEKRYT